MGKAAEYHGVNPNILLAIQYVESSFNTKAQNKNSNQTTDLGITGINSVHFPRLKEHGVESAHLSDGCVSTYVGAWLLREKIERYGNNWYGIAAYHSMTPYFNSRYQILLKNTLREWGLLDGTIEAVPSIKP